MGTGLLMLPISSQERVVTPFLDALFTATSAVCVTGLVVVDTGTYWSIFGQLIIILLIQIGGLGVVTVGVFFALVSKKRITLFARGTMQDALAAQKVGGIVRLARFILTATFIIELIGMVLLMPVFVKDYGLKGAFMAFFHSISAFCNAGFDLFGGYGSLISYQDNPLVLGTIMLLIIVGGLGFITWHDIKTHGLRLRHYRVQSKMILTATAFLLVIPTAYFYAYDLPGNFLGSLFMTVTPRTAGFSAMDLSLLSEAGLFVTMALMLIGGAPGSTAGGMKTTTIVTLFGNAHSTFFRKIQVQIFGRAIDDVALQQAATIFLLYIVLFFTGGLIISISDQLPMSTSLFESASAIGTVGLSLGATPSLGLVSRLVLIGLMYFGRVGPLTLIYATLPHSNAKGRVPEEKITIG